MIYGKIHWASVIHGTSEGAGWTERQLVAARDRRNVLQCSHGEPRGRRDQHVASDSSVAHPARAPATAALQLDLAQLARLRSDVTLIEVYGAIGGSSVMPDYRVSFYKTLLTSDGHPSRCLQECIDVRDLADATAAAEAAAKAFEARHGLRDWKVYADTIDVALAPSTAENRSESRRASVTARRRTRLRA